MRAVPKIMSVIASDRKPNPRVPKPVWDPHCNQDANSPSPWDPAYRRSFP